MAATARGAVRDRTSCSEVTRCGSRCCIPTYWPEVRRGSPSASSTTSAPSSPRRGHEVTLLTTHPGPPPDSRRGRDRVRPRPPPPAPARARAATSTFIETAPVAALRLLRGRFDVAHAFYPPRRLAAVEARRLGGPPVVFSFHGIPTRDVPGRAPLPARDDAADGPRGGRGHGPERGGGGAVPPLPAARAGGAAGRRGASRFGGRDREPGPPTLLCAASFADPRKRIPLLLAAFERSAVRAPRPGCCSRAAPTRSSAASRRRCPRGPSGSARGRPRRWRAPTGRRRRPCCPRSRRRRGWSWSSRWRPARRSSRRARAPARRSSTTATSAGCSSPTTRRAWPRRRSRPGACARPATAGACRRRAADFDWNRLLDAHLGLYERVITDRR